jgi:Transposase
VDWAEAEHAACLLDAAGAVVRRLTIPHRPAGLARLRAAIAAVKPAPAAVLVAIDRPDGLLVDGLLAAGYVVDALNPKAVERTRERTRRSGGKTAPADAELLARILVTDRDRHRPVRPSGPLIEALRVLARQDEVAGRTRTVVARTACNRFLRQALLRWACCSLTRSAWARASYDQHRRAGKTHFAALRILATRWLGILHHLLATGQRYDEAVHQRNRAHASADTAA